MAVNGLLLDKNISDVYAVQKLALYNISEDDFNGLKTWIYILTAAASFITLFLLTYVIVLNVTISKLSTKLKKIQEENRNGFGNIQQDYKISRPRINNGNNYQRFVLPSKLETDTNSDVFFGGGTPGNNPSTSSRNPLSQPPGLNRQKSFNYEGEPANKGRLLANSSHLHYQNPASDYFNISDRSKFTY